MRALLAAEHPLTGCRSPVRALAPCLRARRLAQTPGHMCSRTSGSKWATADCASAARATRPRRHGPRHHRRSSLDRHHGAVVQRLNKSWLHWPLLFGRVEHIQSRVVIAPAYGAGAACAASPVLTCSPLSAIDASTRADERCGKKESRKQTASCGKRARVRARRYRQSLR